MTSTTDDSICQYCGSMLPFTTLNILGHDKKIYRECSCPDAVKERERIEREEVEAEKEEQKRNFYSKLENAGIKKRYIHAQHELANPLSIKVICGQSLYIWGAFGTGKTHLASAIARVLIWQNKRVRILTGIDLTMMLQATYGSNESEADVLGKLSRYQVLIIDDLGKEPPSDWVLSRLFSIVNARYEAMLPLIITTNYEKSKLIERLSKHGDSDTAEAIVSRLCEMSETIRLDGADRRLA